MFPFSLGSVPKQQRLRRRNASEATSRAAFGEIDDSGCPLQKAIAQDLRLLQVDFEQQQGINDGALKSDPQNPSSSLDPPLSHSPRGSTFRKFKEIFRTAKVSLLHTRFAPSGVDQGSFSQILYGACWSLLAEASRNTDVPTTAPPTSEDASFLRASFAVFCLYAMYETNPLPRAVPPPCSNDIRGVLAMLPHGIAPTHSAARRAFRAPIRVDVTRYLALARLLDESLRRCAKCEAARCDGERHARLQRPRDPLSSSGGASEESPSPEGTWTCACGIASDAGHVIRRLLLCLDYCSYSGPCGLEALAMHPDYHCQSHSADRQDSSSEDIRPHSATSTPEPHQLATASSPDLEAHLQEYLRDCASIRLPHPISPPTPWQSRLGRVLNGLAPIFHDQCNSGSSPLASREPRVARWLRSSLSPRAAPDTSVAVVPRVVRLKRFHVTFDVPTVGPHTSTASNQGITSEANGIAMETTGRSLSEMDVDSCLENAHEFLLPDDLSEEQQRSVQAALESLTSRADHLLNLPAAVALKLDKGDVCLATREDVSTIGGSDPGISIGSSAIGQSALRKLISCAGLGKSLESSSSPDVSASDDFLDMSQAVSMPPPSSRLRRQRRAQTEDLQLSDLSSDEEALSVAASAVGQKALQELLAQSAAHPKPVTRKSPYQRKRRRDGSPVEPEVNDDGGKDTDVGAEDASTAASTTGKRALDHLLLMSTPGPNDGPLASSRNLKGKARPVHKDGAKPSAYASASSNETHGRTTRRFIRSAAKRSSLDTTSLSDDSSSRGSESNSTLDGSGGGQAALYDLLSRM